MNLNKHLIFFVMAFLFLILGQISSGTESLKSMKAKKYYLALLKRPDSKSLFQRFQSSWLEQASEQSMEAFLKSKANDGSVESVRIYALFLLQNGKAQQSVKVLSSGKLAEESNSGALLDRARAYERLREFAKAASDVNKALILGGNEIFMLDANKLKGRLLSHQGKTEEAISHWKNLAKKNSKNSELIEDIIDILVDEGLYPAAIVLAEKLRKNTKRPYEKALRTLRIGDIIFKQGKVKEAVGKYVDALKVSGRNSWLEREVLGQVNKIYRAKDDIRGLAIELSEISQLFPQRMHIELARADILLELGRYDELKSIYHNLLKQFPGDQDIKVSYFRVLIRIGDLKSATTVIDELINTSKNKAHLYIKRAELNHKMKLFDEVLVALKNYKKVVKKNEFNQLKYAAYLDQFGFRENAILAYNEAVRAYSDSINVSLIAAKYFYIHGRKLEAENLWNRCSKDLNGDGIVLLLEDIVKMSEYKFALNIINRIYNKNKENLNFLKLAIVITEHLKEHKIAAEYSIKFLLKTQKTKDFEYALSSAIRVIVKAELVGIKIKELKSKGKLLVAEEFLLMELMAYAGDVNGSDSLLKNIAKTDNISTLMQLSRVYEKRYEYVKAASILEGIIRRPEQVKSIYLKSLKRIYQRSGDLKKALKTIQKWKLISPNSREVWLEEVELVKVLYGNLRALEIFQTGLSKFDKNSEIYSKLALLNIAVGRSYRAESLYWKLYDDSESLEESVRWAGELAKNTNGQANLNRLVDEFIRRKRDNPKGWKPVVALAEVYRLKNKDEERRNLLLEAIRIRPNDSSLMIQLATLHSKHGANREAIKLLRKVVIVDTSDYAKQKLASLLIAEGDYKDALDVLAHEPANYDGLTKKGVVLSSLERRQVEGLVMQLMKQYSMDEARTYLENNLKKYPDDWRLLLLQSIIHYEQGYAKKAAEGALKLFTNDNEIQNLTKGWTPRNDSKIKYFMIDSDPITERHLQMIQLPQAYKVIASLSQSMNNRFYRGQMPNHLGPLLPKNLSSMRLLALSLFFTSLEELNTDDQEYLYMKAKSVGINDPELLYEIYGIYTKNRNKNFQLNGRANVASQQEINKLLLKRLRSKPKYKELYSLLVINKLQSYSFVLPSEVLRKAKIMHGEDRDSFISRSLDLFAIAELDKKALLKDALIRIQKNSTIKSTDVLMLLSQNNLPFWVNKVKLDPEVLEALERYIKQVKKVPSGATKLPNLTEEKLVSMFQHKLLSEAKKIVLKEMYRTNDYKILIRAIERETYEDLSKSNLFHEIKDNSLTDFLSTVNQLQSAYFLSGKNSKLKHKLGVRPKNLDKKKLAENIDEFTNPILKLLAIRYAKPNYDIIPLIEGLKKNSITKVDAHLLHAFLLQDNSVSETLRQLIIANKHTTIDRQRLRINSKLVELALEMKGEDFNELDEELKIAVKVASRRLILSGVISRAHQVLHLITKFSMEKEKSKFLTKRNLLVRSHRIATVPQRNSLSNYTSISSVFNTSYGRLSFEKKLKASMAHRHEERAVNLLYQKLRILMKLPSYDRKKFYKLTELINLHGLGDSLLVKAHPMSFHSPQKWILYFELGKMLKNKEVQQRAVAHLSKFSKVPDRAHLPVILAIYQEDKKRAMSLLMKSTSITTKSLLLAFDQELKKNTRNPELYVSSLEFINSYITLLGDKSVFRLSGAHVVRDLLWYCADIKRAGLNGLKLAFATIPSKNKDLIKRRDHACRQFALSAMRYTLHTSELSFKVYIRDLSEVEKYSHENISIAKESLIQQGKLKKQLKARRSGFIIDFFTNKRDREYALAEDRISYLAKASFVRKEAIDDDFLKDLRVNNKASYITLQRYKSHLTASYKTITSELEKLKLSDELSDYSFWFDFCKIRHDLKLEAKIAEIYFSYIQRGKMNLKKMHSGQIHSKLLKRATNILYENKKKAIVHQYLNRVVDRVMNRVKGQEVSMWLNLVEQARRRPTKIDKFSVAVIMRHLLNNPHTLADAVEFVAKYNYPIGVAINGYGFSMNDDSLLPDKLYEHLLEAGYIGGPDSIVFNELITYTLPYLKSQRLRGERLPYNLFSAINRKGNMRFQYDVQYLASLYKYLGRDSYNLGRMHSLVRKLEQSPEKNRYGSMLFLALMDATRFEKFVRFNLPLLKKAPREHLNALRLMFNLHHSVQLRAILKKYSIDTLFE